MVKDIIDGIRDTESRAAGILEEARKKRAEIVARARDEARKIIEKAHADGKEAVKQAVTNAQTEADARIAAIAAEEEKTRKRVVESSSGNVGKAVDFVIERMLK
jgi:vacuolar-type H+-ATPase subunit H